MNVASNIKEGPLDIGLNLTYSILIISGSVMGLAVIISSVIQVNDMSQTSLNSLAKRYWIVFYAFSKDHIKAYQGTDLKNCNPGVALLPVPTVQTVPNSCYIVIFD